MSLGRRAIERGGRAIFKTTSPASAPREPLPFLYPRFFGTATSQRTAEQKNNEDSQKLDLSAERNQKPNEPPRDVKASRDAAAESTMPTTEASVTSNDSEEAAAHIRRVAAKLLRHQDRRHALKDYENITKQIHRNERREAMGTADTEEVDWRNVYDMLLKNTPHGNEISPGDGVKVIVPSTSVEALLFHTDDNIWRIKQRTSCDIQLLPAENTTADVRTLSLSGYSDNILRACVELRRIVPNCMSNSIDITQISAFGINTTHVSENSTSEKTIQPSITRLVRAENRIELVQDLDAIKDPDSWTQKTFERHVLRLTKSAKSRKGTVQLMPHVEEVRACLIELFEDPSLRHVISTTAFNLALSYFISRGQFIKDGRRLFVAMEMIGLRMDTETFNIMLRGAAKSQDLHNFSFLLRMMLKRGHRPDAGTWLAFLSSVTDFEIKAHIIAGMRRKGLLQQVSVVRSLARRLVSYEIQWSIMKGEGHHEFIKHMDRRYGSQWLTTSAGNRIIYQLADHGLISRCCNFAQFMKGRFVKSDNYSLNSVINRCRILGNLDGAIYSLKIFSELGVQPDAATYNDLFHLALDKRMYSFARVVWRYACLNEATTFSMRMFVRNKSKMPPPCDWLRPIPEGLCSPRQRWLQTAGKVIFGNVKPLDHPTAKVGQTMSQLFNLRNSRSSNIFRKSRTRRVNRVVKMNVWDAPHMYLDLTIHKSLMPTKSLAEVLEEAVDLDQKWEEEKVWHKHSLAWMLMNAIRIPVMEKSKGRRLGRLKLHIWI